MEKLIQSKVIKVLAIIAILIMPIMIGNSVQADAISGAGNTATDSSYEVNESKSLTDILTAGTKWITGGRDSVSGFGSKPEDFVSEFIGIGQILVAVGIVTLIIVAIITAIRWLTATPDKQAKLKVQLIGLVVSIVVIFGAVGIWNFVRGILNKVETDPNMLGSNNETIIVANK